MELAEARYALARALRYVGVAPAVDLGARQSAHVAAEAVTDPVAGRHAGDVPFGQRPARRPAGGKRALTVRPGPRGSGRIADEVRVLLADQAERGAPELAPEGRQLPVDRAQCEPKRRASRPDPSLHLLVTEHRATERESLEFPPDKLAVLQALRAGELGAELVELPRIDDHVQTARVPDRVAVAPPDLDTPPRSLGGREAKQLGQVRHPSRETAARRVVSSSRVRLRLSQPIVRDSALNIGEKRPPGYDRMSALASKLTP